MKLHSYSVMLAAAGAAIAMGTPAVAQVGDGAVLNILRECARIDDPTARLACYDNNIRAGGYDGQRPVVPGQAGTVSGGAAVVSGNTPQGFGSEDIRQPDRFMPESAKGGLDEISARVASATERQPGIWLVTLDGGAQWQFSESVSRTFRPPRKGQTVKIERAALGSFLMVIDGQKAVRVRRTQ